MIIEICPSFEQKKIKKEGVLQTNQKGLTISYIGYALKSTADGAIAESGTFMKWSFAISP